MSFTNFATLTNEQKTTWSKQLWRQARNQSFIGKFLGTDANSLIQHITELKKSEKGARAVVVEALPGPGIGDHLAGLGAPLGEQFSLGLVVAQGAVDQDVDALLGGLFDELDGQDTDIRAKVFELAGVDHLPIPSIRLMAHCSARNSNRAPMWPPTPAATAQKLGGRPSPSPAI